MQPQATIEFNLLCQNNNDETIITWDYNDFQSNTYFTYNECSGDSGMYSVFKFSINETSCGCNPVIGSAPFPNKYFIQALYFGYCYVEGEVGDYDQLVLSEFIIPEDPNINILFPEDGCAPEEFLLKITQNLGVIQDLKLINKMYSLIILVIVIQLHMFLIILIL